MLSVMTSYGSTLLVIAMLAVAAWHDLRRHRIPNWLTLGGLLLGLALQAGFAGWTGLRAGLGGMVVALAIFLPGYLLRTMGAGDVKLAAALGTLLGPGTMFLAACFTLIAGGVLALLVLWRRGGLRAAGARYLSTAQLLAATGRIGYVPPRAGEAAATRFPYAVAIATGTLAALWWTVELQAFQWQMEYLLESLWMA